MTDDLNALRIIDLPQQLHELKLLLTAQPKVLRKEAEQLHLRLYRLAQHTEEGPQRERVKGLVASASKRYERRRRWERMAAERALAAARQKVTVPTKKG